MHCTLLLTEYSKQQKKASPKACQEIYSKKQEFKFCERRILICALAQNGAELLACLSIYL
jgi:hypothetical protein